MKETDFDLLCTGSSPEEAKRLRKLLAEWARGDENSFPVQLALLTRAQWRASASLAGQFVEQRRQWGEETARLQSSITAATKAFATEMNLQLSALKAEVTHQSTAMKDAAATIRTQLMETDSAAREVRQTLGEGRKAWDKAKADFDAERQKLETVHRQALASAERDTWIALLMLAMIAGMLGLALGWHLGEKQAARKLPTATPVAAQPR